MGCKESDMTERLTLFKSVPPEESASLGNLAKKESP